MTIHKILSNSLLNLPEEVLRIIFGHLDDKTLYCRVRAVCHQLKMQIDSYVELGIFVRKCFRISISFKLKYNIIIISFVNLFQDYSFC